MRYCFSLIKRVLHVFFPINCVICHRVLPYDDELHVCSTCYAKFPQMTKLFCQKCGKSLPDGGAHCYDCLRSRRHYEYIRAAGVYDGTLRDIIHKFKYKNCDFLDTVLAKFMVERLANSFPWDRIDYIIPVPLHRKGYHVRGYNQAALLANKLSKYFNKPVLENVLLKIRRTKAQASLNKEERLRNLTDAYYVREKEVVRRKNILLVDDVCTTGTTIEECSKVLKNSGANKIWAMVVAHGV